jgi:hypothetical protein
VGGGERAGEQRGGGVLCSTVDERIGTFIKTALRFADLLSMHQVVAVATQT